MGQMRVWTAVASEAEELPVEKAPPERRPRAAGVTPKYPRSDCGMEKSAPKARDGVDGEETRAEVARVRLSGKKENMATPCLVPSIAVRFSDEFVR